MLQTISYFCIILIVAKQADSLLEPKPISGKQSYIDVLKKTVIAGSSVVLASTLNVQKSFGASTKKLPDASLFYSQVMIK
jgi:hypothetical protein